MKKIFLFAMMLTMGLAAHAQCQDGPYGLKINGTRVVDAPKFGELDQQGRVQYKASCVALQAGDEIQLVNQSCDATWMVDLDPYGEYQKFDGGKAANKLTCKVAGNYDFYIKLSASEGDILYIGPGEDCGGGQGGGGGVEGNPRYYYKGYIDGQDVEPSEATLFDHGLAELDVTADAYVFVLYQVDGFPGVQYMTAEYVDGPTQATLLTTGGQKFHIGAGSYTLYLYDNEDGTLEISTQAIPGKKLADPQPAQGLNDTMTTDKARKAIVNGQLVIIRGDKMFDATGRQL